MPQRAQRPVQRLGRASAALAAALWLSSCAAPGTQPGPVTAVTVTAVPAGVVVAWSGSEGASGFVVYRAPAGEGMTELARVPGAARKHADYTAEPGVAYAYAVAAVGPGGPGEHVVQEAGPVAALPGARLTVDVDGPGTVVVEGPAGPVTCSEDCVVGFEPGSEASLAGVDGDLAFAGFGEPCPPTPECLLTVDEDISVEALFRAHVLRLSLDGDAPVSVTFSPPDDRGHDACQVRPDADCLLGFTYTAGSTLQVSVNAAPVDPDAARVLGLAGDCETSQRFCVADLGGAASVAVIAAVTPVAVPDDFAVRADSAYDVRAPGVLANDEVGGTARVELVAFAGPGQLHLGADGSFSYSPPARPPENVTFSYRVRGAHDVAGPAAEVGLALVPPPRAAPDEYATAEDADLSVPAPGVLANDAADGEVEVELVAADGHGEVDLAPDGSFVFRPGPDDVRPYGFTYRVRNELGAVSEEATVTVAVAPVNDPPSFALLQETVSARPGQAVTVEGFAHDVSPGGGEDEAGQGLRFLVNWHEGDRPPFFPAPSIDGQGTLRFTGFGTGSATFEVVLQDSGGAGGGPARSEPRYFTITLQ